MPSRSSGSEGEIYILNNKNDSLPSCPLIFGEPDLKENEEALRTDSTFGGWLLG